MFTVQVLKLPLAGSGLHLDRSKFSLLRHSVSTSSIVKAYEMPLTTCRKVINKKIIINLKKKDEDVRGIRNKLNFCLLD